MSERTRVKRNSHDISIDELHARYTGPAARVPKDERDARHRRPGHLVIGAGAAAVVLGVGSFLGIKAATGDKSSPDEARPDATTSASPNPGETNTSGEQVTSNVYSAPEDASIWTDGGTYEAYEEAKTPMMMTMDQQSAWETGDISAQNDVASDVFANRLQVALYDAYQAKVTGKEAEFDYLTTDPAVIKNIEQIIDYYIEVAKAIDDPTDEKMLLGFEVCRTNTPDLDPFYSVCAEENNSTGKEISFSPNSGDMHILIARHTENDFDGAARDDTDPTLRNNEAFMLKWQLQQQGEVLTLISR